MFARLFAAALMLLAVVSLSAFGATAPSSAPVLFGLTGAHPQALAEGAQQLIPVKIDERQAFDAIFKGGMWIPDGAGGRVYAKYARHILHANGDWTFIGAVQTAHGAQSAVITFGKDAVFGRIPQASGYPLRLLTTNGKTFLLRTDGAALARSPHTLMLHAQPDNRIPLRVAASARAQARSASAQSQQAQATSNGQTIIDVMVAYTPGFVSETGSTSQALTRINNLVDLTNQAYSDSQVHQSIRLVYTMEVNYTDANSNTTALDDITGNDGNGNSVPIPAGLQPVAPARDQYGADLVVLMRSFDNATDGGCGVGWEIGGGEQQIVPSQDYVFGYSVVSDGSDGGYYCLDSTFAHELGHNMGNAHDRANADGPGAYPYSYGYLGNGTYGFSTIMAYGTSTDTPLNYFSNPNISICQNTPCGVADSSSNSADNAHSMNNTAPLIAQFEPTQVTAITGTYHPHNDFNGDGKSDIAFFSPGAQSLVYWKMYGNQYQGYRSFSVSAGYTPIGSGDFDGNGGHDLLWTDGTTLYMWLNDGSGGFVNYNVLPFPSGGWQVLGTGDVNGDGKDDILWYNPGAHSLVYWIMSGASYVTYKGFTVPAGFNSVGVGDLDGDGHVDVLWSDPSRTLYVWLDNGSTFTQRTIMTYSAGWMVAGVGDVDGDGKDDLLWFNPSTHSLVYWLMNGATYRGYKGFNVDPSYIFAGVGDFDGNHKADILWTTSSRYLYMWLGNSSNTFTPYAVTVPTYAAGWNILP